jgi:hypothetical protein
MRSSCPQRPLRARQRSYGALVAVFVAATAFGNNTVIHATGTFDVKMAPGNTAPAENVGRMSLDKTYHGDLDAIGKGEMLSAGDPATGNAGYVAIERVTGTLNGKKGSFAVMQIATMATGSVPQLQAIIAPGSGTGELTGITGSMKIIIEIKQHRYEFDYRID